MALWNEINLESPNEDFCVYDAQDVQIIDDMSNLVSTLNNAASQIGAEHPAWNEVKVFLVLQERVSLKLPCDKFLHILKMVGRCLQNLVFMKLFERYLDLAERFLHGIRNSSNTAKLPSRQQLEYLLIRTQGAAKLIIKAISYIEETFVNILSCLSVCVSRTHTRIFEGLHIPNIAVALWRLELEGIHIIQRMKIGHLIQILLMTVSAIGRIRTTYLALLKQLSDIYQHVKPWQNRLKPGTWKWPHDPDLPENLWQWLKPESFEDTFSSTFPQSEESLPFLKLFFRNDMSENRASPLNVNDRTEDDENDVIILSDENDDDDCILLNPDDDIGEVQPRTTANMSNQMEVTATGSIHDGDETVAECDNESTLLLDSVKETSTIKELLFVLKLLCFKKQTALRKIFLRQMSKEVQAEVKDLFLKLKNDIRNSKSLSIQLRKTHRKLLFQKSKKELLSIFDCYEVADDGPDVMENDVQIIEIIPKKSNLMPVYTIPNLHKLFNGIKSVSNKKSKQFDNLSSLFERGSQDAKLLQENGENVLCKKHVFRISKKIINLYKKMK